MSTVITNGKKKTHIEKAVADVALRRAEIKTDHIKQLVYLLNDELKRRS